MASVRPCDKDFLKDPGPIWYWEVSSFFLSFFKIVIYLAAPSLSWGMQDLVPRPGIESGLPALGAQSLNYWTTREVPVLGSF